MKLPLVFAMMCSAVFCLPVSGQVGPLESSGGLRGGVGGARKTEKVGEFAKLPLNAKVLQVVPVGLLFATASSTILVIGHPKQGNLAEGERVNCYIVKMDQLYEYASVDGATRTVRVYRYVNERIGK